MKLKKIILISFALVCAHTINAQNNNKSAVKVQNSSTKTSISSNTGKVEIQTGTSNPNAKKFTFTGSYTMKFSAKDTKGKISSAEIKSAFEDYKMASIPSFSDDKTMNLRSVFDLKENTMTMLFVDAKKNKKNGMLMKIPKVSVTNTSSDVNVSSTIQKTNESKIIDTYKCNKWIITYSDGAKAIAWITTDLKINTAEAVSFFITGMKGKKSPVNTECANIKGCALESLYTAKDGSTVFMKMTDIRVGKPDASFFSTSGYEITDVSGIQFFK